MNKEPTIPANWQKRIAEISFGKFSFLSFIYTYSMKRKVVIANNYLQKNYKYELTEPKGKNFEPGFKPELTPKEMIDLGIFSGQYSTVSEKEFPKSWFSKNHLHHKKRDRDLNFFKVDASQPLSVWKKKGWIHPNDPSGWFQWYCRYYMGRRSIDDERQIKRWKAIKRHVAQVKKNCRRGDMSCRPRQRQALLHWAYDSRKI